MTTIYFVRHAEPNYENHNDISRELSNKGLEDRKLVTEFLVNKQIDILLSSPYKRAVDTIRDFAERKGLGITIINDFKERRVLEQYRNKTIVVGSHGTVLSTIINYYDKTFGYSDFGKIRYLMPWIVEFTFEDKECVNIQKYNLFEH